MCTKLESSGSTVYNERHDFLHLKDQLGLSINGKMIGKHILLMLSRRKNTEIAVIGKDIREFLSSKHLLTILIVEFGETGGAPN